MLSAYRAGGEVAAGLTPTAAPTAARRVAGRWACMYVYAHRTRPSSTLQLRHSLLIRRAFMISLQCNDLCTEMRSRLHSIDFCLFTQLLTHHLRQTGSVVTYVCLFHCWTRLLKNSDQIFV